MSLIAVVDANHDDLALSPTIRRTSGVSIQVLPHSGTDPETGMFFFLARADEGDFDGFDETLAGDHTVGDAYLVAEDGDTRIYRIGHTDRTQLLTPKMAELGGLMLEATSNDRGWTMRMQFPDRETLARLWQFCGERDIRVDLVRLYRKDEWAIDDTTGLTEAQRTTLVTAYNEGYFDEPREASLQDLAEQLDISPTAVGGRIRRGTAALVEQLLEDP